MGIGGTLAKHVAAGDEVHICIIADALPMGDRQTDCTVIHNRTRKACQTLGVSSVRFAGLPDGKLDTLPFHQIIDWIERVAQELNPTTVYTHHWGDINSEHRLVHQAVTSAFRPTPNGTATSLLTYETPSSTDWQIANRELSFVPNVYVDVTETLEIKMKALDYYAEELKTFPHVRSKEAIRALALWRGASVGLHAAEAFYLMREVRR